ncbi:hypothetical protein TGGT1_360500 [Toxoplasma gondii GT1]|uniref:Uncharacterized protein n=3 Tax=Toxoplasma gondii TaxID=5811 RepID=S7W687_TOXGG|nr:hypothetical protein TGGT1_360500 [Toxoplasma gondii GT1]KAF4643572.1 hypothetical protein TGRH88_032380 [Toxoplasma gondii]RQX70649.1 hypothetical protein TGCAST_360500 [Toxoplasma gondii CAST]
MQTHRSRQGLFPPAVQTGGASPAASQDAVSSLCLSSSLSSAVASPVSPTFENASGDSFSSLGFSGPLSPLHSPAEEETTAALPAVAVREESCFSEEAKKFSERRESTRVQEQQQEQRDTRAEETTGDREGEGDVVVQERETEHLSEAEVHPFPRNSSDTALFLSSSLDSEKTGDSSASPREALLRRLQGHLRFLSSFSTTQQLPPCSALWNAKTKHAERRTSSTTRMNSSERTSKDSSKLQTRQSTPEYAQTKKTHLRQPSARSTTSRHPSLPSSHPSSSSLPSSHPSSSSRQSTSLPSSRRSRPSSVKRSPGGQSTLRDRGSAACPPQRSVKASSLRCPCISPRRRLQMSAASKKLRGEEEWRREAGTERNMEETKRDTGERKPLTGREEGREGQDVREGKNGTERGESGVDTALKGLAEKEEANKVGGTKSSVLDELESEIEKGVFKADLVIAATTEEQGEEGAEQKDGCFKDTEEARAQSSTASSLARQQKKTQPAQRREEEREREGEKEREGRAAASTGKGRWSVSGGGMDGPREATKLTMEQEKNAKLLEDLCVKFTAHKLLQMRRSRAVAFSREGSEGENRPADLLSRAARTSRGDMRSTTNEEKERGDKENGTSGVTEEAQEDEEVKGRFTETCSSIRLHPSSTSQQPRKTRGSVACSLSSSRSCSLSRSVRSAGSFSDQQTELPTLLSRICGPSLKKADAARKANTKTGQSAKRYEEESAQTAEERLPGQGVGTICPSSVRSTKRIDETPFSASPTSRVSLPASEKSDCRLPSSPYSPEKRPLSSRSRRRHVILLTPLPSSSPLASPFLSASTSSSAFPSSSSSAFPSSSSSSAFPSSSSSALPSSSSSAFPSSSSAFPSSSSSAFPSSSSSAFPSSSSSAFPSSSSSAFPSSSSSAFPSSTRRATRRECTDARRSFRRGEGEADFEKMRETSAARRERREDGARLTDLRGKEGAFTASQDKNRTRKSREPSANAGLCSSWMHSSFSRFF